MSQIAANYAQALYSLAQEEAQTKQILDEMAALDSAFGQEPGFLRMLSAPNISKEQRCAILDDSFRGKIAPYLLNFLKLLTEKRYIRQFSDCCKAYRALYYEENGIMPVNVVSAVELTQSQREKLQKKLETLTGKTVELTNRVDPEVLGGIRLDYDGKRVDGTVKNRLDSVRELLKNTVI